MVSSVSETGSHTGVLSALQVKRRIDFDDEFIRRVLFNPRVFPG